MLELTLEHDMDSSSVGAIVCMQGYCLCVWSEEGGGNPIWVMSLLL